MSENKYARVVGCLIILLAIGCSSKKEKLPYYGNVKYEGNDTIYHTIQDFEVMDQDSNVVNNQTFTGQIYVADFFFTFCPTICPVMTKQMTRVYQKYEGNNQVALLSHTIAPSYDSIPVLKDYANKLGAKTEKWRFVTADRDYIYDLGEKSYMVMADKDPEAAGGYVHSGAFLLIDKERRVRGVYDGTEKEQVDKLLEDMDVLLKEYAQ